MDLKTIFLAVKQYTARKASEYRVFSGPYFSVFSPVQENTDKK